MGYMSQELGYLFLFCFGVGMLVVTYLFARWKKFYSKDGFLVASRQVGWITGSTSIAASWIWAPALFLSVQFAYEKGLAGIFWFTFPNILALAIFGFLAPRIRALMPEGYTLPGFIRHRLKSENLHKVYLVPYFFYQIMAVTVQLFAGGGLVSLLTGIPLVYVMPILALIALIYTWISGLEASIVTDFVQLSVIFIISAIILPMVWQSAGGWEAVSLGLSGIGGTTDIFDPGIAFSLGIVTSIGLISGAICDQQYWQRTFAIRKDKLATSFILGSLLFGIIPIALSLLGFIAANPLANIHLPEGVDISLIGVQAVATLLPSWAVFLFIAMLLCGLCSTMDSGLSAASSLWVADVKKTQSDQDAIDQARVAMVGSTILGLAIAYAVHIIPGFGLFHLFWVVNTVGACIAIPTVLSLYTDRLNPNSVLVGVVGSFLIGLPLFIYSNILDNPTYIVASSLFIITVSTLCCMIKMRKKYS